MIEIVETALGIFMSLVFCGLIIGVYWMLWAMGQVDIDE